jgi:hypothetical protein
MNEYKVTFTQTTAVWRSSYTQRKFRVYSAKTANAALKLAEKEEDFKDWSVEDIIKL